MQPTLGSKPITLPILASAVLLACAAVHAQDFKTYILAARRSGAIEIIDPTSLATIGRIHFDLPPSSVGLNGISASVDGTVLYVEGPIPDKPNGCCVLYSIDLATLQARQVAGIGGTASRAAFVNSDGITYPAVTLRGGETRFSGGVLDVYDDRQGKFLHFMMPPGFGTSGRPNGIWMDDRFLLYAVKDDGSDARLWSVSLDATELGAGAPVEPFAKVPGCSSNLGVGLAGITNSLFLYERFGRIDDRRTSCSGVPGGAWIVDPSSGRLLAHVASEFYFSELVADHIKGELYGISVGDPNWRGGVELVRMHARDGSILKSRVLESDYWRIVFAPLRNVPAADVHATISAKK